jgi:hypothetical protein
MTGIQQCFVAFLDILGFSELTRRCAKDPDLQERLLLALLEAQQVPRFSTRTISNTPEYSGTWTLQAQVVSDTVILFIPVSIDHAALLLNSVRVLHDRMFSNQVLLRGAITIGDMYWNDDWSSTSDLWHPPRQVIAFGQGLIDAYEMESKLAVHPRILVSDRFVDYVKRYSWNEIPNPLCEGNLDSVFRCCEDGLQQFDILHPGLKRQPKIVVVDGQVQTAPVGDDLASMPHPEYLSSYRSVLTKLPNHEQPRVRAKIEWLVHYFNSVVKDMPNGNALRIDLVEEPPEDGLSPRTAVQSTPPNNAMAAPLTVPTSAPTFGSID